MNSSSSYFLWSELKTFSFPHRGTINKVCVLFLQGEVLFKNWESIFSNHVLPAGIPLYSFDGRDVMSDPFWSVNYPNS